MQALLPQPTARHSQHGSPSHAGRAGAQAVREAEFSRPGPWPHCWLINLPLLWPGPPAASQQALPIPCFPSFIFTSLKDKQC